VAPDPLVARELARIHAFYRSRFVSVEPGGAAALYRDHGWYPEGQEAADALFEDVLAP
jgi:hypothetical protein